MVMEQQLFRTKALQTWGTVVVLIMTIIFAEYVCKAKKQVVEVSSALGSIVKNQKDCTGFCYMFSSTAGNGPVQCNNQAHTCRSHSLAYTSLSGLC